ncbi:MAG: ribonuclease P protein component [Acidaminococcales bacterium]|jgi:ribonuclease P protein component|nr:ribonuclease P protein component [Acidaminococcales bacterium]
MAENGGRLSYKFGRSLRLRKKKDFQKVYEKGRSFGDYAGILRVLPLRGSQEKRFGVAAGKKLGNAVRRNRMKRMMREVCRHFQHEVKEGAAFIWIARRPLLKAGREAFERTFLNLAEKARILVKKERGEECEKH